MANQGGYFRMRLFFLTFMFLVPSPVFSSELINSAFGLSLGSSFPESKVKVGATAGGVPLYRFAPKNPVSSLKNYGVILTPNSGRVVEIWAWERMSGSAKCGQVKKQLEAALDEKYFSLKQDFTIGDLVLYSDGNRNISLSCPISFGFDPLYLQYKDKKLEFLRVSETNESENLDGL
jgi:hypothetical protein